MISNLKAIIGILNAQQKKYFVFIVMLSFIGMVFEVFGLGLLIPTLSIVLSPDFGSEYPLLQPFLNFLGNPSQKLLVSYVLYAFVFFFLLKTIYMIWLIYKQSNFAAALTDKLAKSLFRGYIGLPYTFHLENNSAILIRNIQTEVQNYTEVIRTVLVLVLESLVSVGIAIFLFSWQPVGTGIVGGVILVAVLAFNGITKKIVKQWGYQRQDAESKVQQHLMQGLGGVKEVKLLGKEPYFLQKFHEFFNQKVFITAKQLALVQVPRLLLEFLAVIGIVAIIFVSISQGVPLKVLLTTVGVFLAAIFRLLPSLSRILASVQVLKFHESVVGLLKKELKVVNQVDVDQSIAPQFNFTSKVSLKGISFSYPNSDYLALKQVNIDISKGECIGVIGKSGSGKSTLIDIILGLINPLIGSVMIDDENIKENMRGWQNIVGYVPQTIYMTDASVKENIAFGSSADAIKGEDVEGAIRSAMLEDFIATLPKGSDTIIGERGARLSGGQRQRIGIARALYYNPELLVLDEATSALDNETEREVMKAVTALKGTTTMIIVAHRHSTLVECDRIYEFDNGKVVRSGTPEELGIT